MNKDKTGGSAYPVHTPAGGNCGPQTTYGMTLRQYYAGQILVGMWSDASYGGSHDDLAREAFRGADAMIKESEKGGTTDD